MADVLFATESCTEVMPYALCSTLKISFIKYVLREKTYYLKVFLLTFIKITLLLFLIIIIQYLVSKAKAYNPLPIFKTNFSIC